jgi:pentatricopeptide repeat protein
VKCGVLEKAREVLEELPARNVVSWNALISGYTQQGYGYEALRCLEKMQEDGLSPDDATLQCVLCACGHSGLMDEAQVLFNDMTNKYGIAPTLEHQTCMVEGFGFIGDFDKAVSMIKVMPSCDDISLWLGMLGACRKWGNVNLGRLCFDQIVQLDGNCASAYVLMANMFASSGMQEEAERVEAMRMKYASFAGGKKISG